MIRTLAVAVCATAAVLVYACLVAAGHETDSRWCE